MAFSIPVNMEAPVQVTFLDAKGNPCSVDKINSIEASDPGLLEVLDRVDTPDGAGNVSVAAFAAVPVGGVGLVQVTVKADPRLADDEEGPELVTVLEFDLLSGEAAVGVASVGALVPNRNVQS